ncbi:MAG TPA: DUF86 domain-containing protein [Bacteroidia bacterium]|jgi:uncharacterized protein with HEPN domain|nr:DUF86 domain-containing protein [Bacteroidia bacterium]
MTKDDLVYITHILERSQKIIEFTAGISEANFLKDEKTQSAVIRELEVIGEASKRISENYRNTNTNIPWKLMAGMRDVLIHDYEGVDALMVWDTIQKSVPELIENLKKVV